MPELRLAVHRYERTAQVEGIADEPRGTELDRVKMPPIARERLVDTLLLARRKHPGVSNRLDDLCSRYAIDNSRRTKHGALLDAELLAEVYVDLIGARQSQLILAAEVRPGNSGGPLVDLQGHVLGLVFAASSTNPDQAYALTNSEVQTDISAGVGRTGRVPTETFHCAV